MTDSAHDTAGLIEPLASAPGRPSWRPTGDQAAVLLQDMFETSVLGMAAVGTDGTIRAANAALAAMLGATRDGFTGVPLTALIHAEDRARDGAIFAAVLAGDAPSEPFETRLHGAGDSTVHVAVRPWPVRERSGAVISLLVTFSDMTALRRREEALTLTEARYRAIVETAVEAIITADVGGTIMSANPAVEHILGYKPEELIGRHIHTLMPRDEEERHPQYLDRYLRTRKPHVIGLGREVRVRRKDASIFAGWLSLTEIKLPGFHVFVSTIRDITPMKNAEMALIEAKEAAELANRAKTAFLSNMSHELRTPLNGILGFADVIQQQMLGSLENPGYLAYAAEIKRSGELLLANINDLLEMATIEAGCVDLDETLVDFREVVVTCLRMIAKRAEHAKVQVQADIATELPPLLADPRALKQVLLHLLSNAVKFTPGGGRIGVSARVDSTGALVAEVFDTGIGIPEDRLETVFQPFVQGDAVLARRFEGIGLGLSIAKSLVEQHGGRLEIRSREGVGTTVLIRLPKDRFLPDW